MKKKHRNCHNDGNVIIDIIIFIVLVIAFIFMSFITPRIKLNGEEIIKLEYGKEYVEPGYDCTYLKKNYKDKVKVESNLDINKVGTYTIKYTFNNRIYNIEKERTIEVVDKISPVITLTGEKEVHICPKTEYKEDGYTAIDEYDGDLTEKVIKTIDNDIVSYTVTDSSNNKIVETRKIIPTDIEKPIITLKGGTTTYVRTGDTYKEYGYSASDNCMGDITNKVSVTGSVDTNTVGTYTLNYSVSDNAGNKTTASRKVIVANGTDPNSGIVKKGVIYLTFDDGPNTNLTTKILDILKANDIKATFFVTKAGSDAVIKREFDEGHTVALHSYSHDYKTIYTNVDGYFKDLDNIAARVKRITGYDSKIVRFPGGSGNTVSRKYGTGIMTKLTNEVLSRGYRYYDWNVCGEDAGACTKVADKKTCVYNYTTRGLSKNKANIVLLHDIKYYTADALQDIITYAKNNGYTFEPITMDTAMVRSTVRN